MRLENLLLPLAGGCIRLPDLSVLVDSRNMKLYPEQQFIDYASEDFGFLTKDFGFAATPEIFCGSGVLFSKDSLLLQVCLGWYKGEVDCDFRLLLESTVFRPYISRTFDLGEVVQCIDKDVISKALKEGPPLPRWALTAEDAHCHLLFQAMLVQNFCLPILSGDFAVLEAITWKRRKEWGQTDVERSGTSKKSKGET
jgi:hypothetical protein